MTLKNAVKYTLIGTFGGGSMLLVAGTMLPASWLESLSSSKASQTPIANVQLESQIPSTQPGTADNLANSEDQTPNSDQATTTPQPPTNPTPAPTTPQPTPPPPTPVTPTPPPPPSAPACGQPGGPCSAGQVASHNSVSDCWMIYAGNYYNLSSYVSDHPGGSGVFNSQSCGSDIGAYMTGAAATGGEKHKHKSSAYTILESYKIGPIQ